jgi:K+-sensing histidine kinase KdpD
MGRYLYRDTLATAAAPVGPLLVCVALVPWRARVSTVNAALILVVVVAAVAANGSRHAGALAALSAAAWFDFFLTEPFQRFTIADPADIETTVLLLIVGLAVSQLAARVRQLKVVTITNAGYLKRIHETAELARSARSHRVVVERVCGELTERLELAECRFEYGSLLGKPPRLERDGRIVWSRRQWDADRLGLP